LGKAASEEMAGQAQMLKGMIQKFQLKKGKRETDFLLKAPVEAADEESEKDLEEGVTKVEPLPEDEFGKY
jgi:hypothetical protein